MLAKQRGILLTASLSAAALAAVTPAHAELSAEQLAKMAQNPIGNLISVPFQDNINFNVGPEDGTQNVLNIQPVIPFNLNADWNLITRTIIPVISQPAFVPEQDRRDGLGDILFSAWLSPSLPGAGGLIWGVGMAVQLPTETNNLGNDNWGLGPTAVVLHQAKGNPWVYGFLVNNVWSVGSGDDPSYNNLTFQYFINYNFPEGLYLTSTPIITANWKADSDDRWTVPFGGGVGKIFHFGKLPVNTQIQAFYNVVTPDEGADWQLRFQVQFLFPK
jgi:hypothetical protein